MGEHEHDSSTADVVPEVYDELRRQAQAYLGGERRDHTLQATALLHEAYLRVAGEGDWADPSHFRAAAARAMRRVLVDHARRRGAAKRGGGALRITLAEDGPPTPQPDPDVLDLEAALEELAALDERQARIVELRTYGGLTLDEAAASLGVSRSTAAEDWRMARAFLSWKLCGS